jgi:magnesium-protoporphyrin O-methyltransferase
VSRCCSPVAYGEFFDEKLARRDADRYRRKGLGRASERFVELVAGRGVEGASVLEVGGGTGTLQIELLERGASRATNVELSPGYETEARRLLEERGLSERAERHVVDLATDPDAVGDADVVLLHRVVCCYPDYESLLSVAAAKARRLVAFSFPPDLAVSRLLVRILNLGPRLRGCDFRSYVHSERAMLSAVERQGFRLEGAERAGVWRLALLERG